MIFNRTPQIVGSIYRKRITSLLKGIKCNSRAKVIAALAQVCQVKNKFRLRNYEYYYMEKI
ncbi:hypothetical protein BWI92_13985 [Flectobacillus sp. BAB-3569]|jgi:hypothetical protein|nr:hypothetical protein BWI92_13985 [Flectobacillus sp. BAB-3569]